MAEPLNRLATSSSAMNLLDSHPHSVADVRRWAAGELVGVADDLLADILLVITELVTNAYDHGGGPTLVRLIRSYCPWRLTVEVEDANSLSPTVGRSRFGAASHRGNGLVLVDKMVTDWGVRPHADTGGKTVWARFVRTDQRHTPGGS